jgi:hypothetical protein
MSETTAVQEAVRALVTKHGSLRKAEKATGINYAYLSRLQRGEKSRPEGWVLDALGLVKSITYKRARK